MKQKNAHLNRTIILAVCLVLVVVLFVTAALNATYVRSVKNLVRSTTTANISELTVSKAQYLDERLRSEQLALQTLANELGAHEDIISLKDLVMDYQALHDVSCMWVFDTKGNGWSTGVGENLYPPGQTEELFAPALRGETGISETFTGEMGKRQVMIYTPIEQEGKIAGGLYESYPAELLQNTYGGTTYNDAGYSYVLGKDGRVVFSSVRYSYLQIYEDFRDVLKEGGNSEEDITAFMDILKAGRRGTATFVFEGETQFLSFTPLEEKDDWYFVTVIPLNMVESDGTVIVHLTVQMAVVVIIAVTVILFLALGAFYYLNKKRREYGQYIHDTYQAISENIDTVIFIVDPKSGKVEYAFENAQEILGIPTHNFYKPESEDTGEFEQRIFRLLWEERPSQKSMQELSLFNKNLNKHMWLDVTVLPVTLLGGTKYIFAFTDITQDRQIRENLSAAVAAAEQANAAKSLFFSNMSHDIRTPMNAIVGMTKLAKVYIEDQSRVEDCLHKIELSSRHLLSLINDVLDMSKIESGKMTMSADPFSLPDLVEGNLAIVQPQCRAKHQQFSVETKDIKHEYLLGDSLRLNQVLLNITSNAVKFTPEQGKIVWSIEELTQRHPGYAVYQFCISDSGVGITPEFMKKIFKPFEREATENVRQTEGTGLGLAIARNIVEAMGGQISVESTVGKGTTFTVELELALQPGASEEMESAQVLFDLRALLVDDSVDDLELLKIYLEESGFIVDTALTGEEAVEIALERDPYDLILMDWKLPGMDGEEAALKIKNSGKGPSKFVLITAFDASALEEDTSRNEFDLILQKPIFKSALCRKLSILFSAQAGDAPDLENVLKDRRFLLVEDNEINREIASELFMLSGALIECAVDGKSGAELFLSSEPGTYDAIFMDIQMPIMDGYEATRYIRSSDHPQAREIPIIAMSANVFAEDIRASKVAGMNAHLGKPIVMENIYRVLKEVL